MKLLSTAFLLLFILAGCSSGKKSTRNDALKNAPEWVKQTPNNPAFYHGVGMVFKAGQQDYRERARQVALSEIAGSISVTISSSSVLNQFEFDRTYSEYFRDNIRTSTQQQLEGFELVENWENDQQYWVYYRLSRSKWAQIRQERIDKALGLSNSKFDQAKSFSAEGKHTDALRFYIRSVEDIRDFLGEDLRITMDNSERSYSTTLTAAVISELQNLKIMFPEEKLTLKPGSTFGNTSLEATLSDENRRPVAGIPVITRLSWLPGNNLEAITDARGKFSISIGKIDSRKRSEQITSIINLDKLVRDNTSDMTVRKLFEGMKVSSFVLPVELIPPIFSIFLNEKNLGKSIVNSGLGEEIGRLLRQDGFEVTSGSNSDYSIVIESDTRESSERNGRFSVTFSATVMVKDRDNKTLYNKSINDITGLSTSFSAAGEDAYRSFTGKFRINIYPEILQTLF